MKAIVNNLINATYDQSLHQEFINFVNKMTEELSNNDVKAAEILQRGDYYVSDIVDYNKFTERKDQKIIKFNFRINQFIFLT